MKNKRVQMLCEGAVAVALALALSYLDLDLWFQGGSIDAVMIPLILFAVRWGAGWGVAVGLVFGTLKYFIGAEGVIDWISIVFDYSVAYACVGFAGVLKGKADRAWLAAIVGSAARFVIHYLSGITVYARYMPKEFMGLPMTSPFLYSALYNGGYMLPNTILAVAACLLLSRVKPIRRWLGGENLR